MRLIDADELKETVGSYNPVKWTSEYGYVIRLEDIDHAPTVDPVKHGRWVDKYGDGDWHCARCGAIVEKHEQDYRNWYFCYHCGARMDGDENARLNQQTGGD